MKLSTMYLKLLCLIALRSGHVSTFVIFPKAFLLETETSCNNLLWNKQGQIRHCPSRKIVTPNPLIAHPRPTSRPSNKNVESATVDDNDYEYQATGNGYDRQIQTKQSPLFRKMLNDAIDIDEDDATAFSDFDNIDTDWTATNYLEKIEEVENPQLPRSEINEISIEDKTVEESREAMIEQGPTQMGKQTNEIGQGVSSGETENSNLQKDTGNISEDGMLDKEEHLSDEGNYFTRESEETSFYDLDDNLVRELNEAVTLLLASEEDLRRDIKVLPIPLPPKYAAPSDPSLTNEDKRCLKRPWGTNNELNQKDEISVDTTILLPLSDTRHSDRINNDIRHLAISIASTIDDPSQWKTFCEDGGGLLPLLESIHNGAREIRQGSQMDGEGMIGLVEQREESFATACSACKTIRDLCAISKPFATIVTDSILNADAVWATRVNDTNTGIESSSGGLISDLVTLLHHAGEADTLYSRQTKKIFQKMRKQGIDIKRRGSQRKITEGRRKCVLYTLQLMLEMAFASDAAVKNFRATSHFMDAVLSHSSYAKSERLRQRWLRYPIDFMKRKLSFQRKSSASGLFIANAIDPLTEEIQGAANQILAAIGHNVWYPKRVGQKGLRILSIDGGGTRGITAISTMRSIVEAMGGVEVCDAFDIIAGTSTGAIIAFLIGLRRESNSMARKRYDQLMKRVFVKSVLSKPMLFLTTAKYDETPFNTVMGEILRDNSMLASRADPRVPLVFAVSSKMSSTPTQLCLFRNYNYNGGEKEDAFVQDPAEARKELDFEPEDDIMRSISKGGDERCVFPSCTQRPGKASRHPGSFRVLQRAAMRATTAAPTVFKPVLMGDELYCDGGIVASNPSAVAIHEARTIFPDVPIEMVVSCGTGAFIEEKNAPRIGWDGILGQIADSATDAERPHHILEDILGQGSTTLLGKSSVSKTKYFRFNPVIGLPDSFEIDGTDPEKLEELSNIAEAYMSEPEQIQKLQEICDITKASKGWRRWIP